MKKNNWISEPIVKRRLFFRQKNMTEVIKDTIAFFGNEIKLGVKVPQIKQIEDYGKS